MKWSDNPPEDFEWGVDTVPECCWVFPNIWGDDEPALGELERHIYPDVNGEYGVIINTMNGGIDVSAESVKRRYCRIPPPPKHGWSDAPPENIGWYWVRTDTGDIDPVMVYLDEEETLVFNGIGWHPSYPTPVTSPNMSWIEIPVPEKPPELDDE